MLLDLNLPKMSGHEVLTRIKANHELRSIPTIILTTSVTDEDVSTAHAA